MMRARKARPALVGAGLAALLAVTVSGCALIPFLPYPTAGSDLPDPGPTESASVSDAGEFPVEFEEFYTQEVDWASCTGMDCATISAPVDWNNPDGETIELSIVRASEADSDQRLGSILLNPGGPGASGTEYAMAVGPFGLPSDVGTYYDLVSWDPRGVLPSSAVSCLDDAERDEWLYGTYDVPYGTAEWAEQLTERAEEFAAACAENTGELLGFVDAVSTAHDMDLIRYLVGDRDLNYLGYSYGTMYGAVYAELFPENVGRMVLDGALDPLVGSVDALAVQMAGFDSAFVAFVDSCLAGDLGDCWFTGTRDQALAQFAALVTTVAAKPPVSSDGRVADLGTLGTGIAGLLYSEYSWGQLDGALFALADGEPGAILAAADSYNRRDANGGYSGNSNEVYIAEWCLDGNFADDPTDVLEGLAKLDAAAPILGKLFAYDDYALLEAACSNWSVPSAPMPESYSAEGAPPIVVVGTSNDPATPLVWAQSLADQLSSGVLVTYEGEGHTIVGQGVACIDTAIAAYFIDGTAPPKGLVC